MNWRACSIAALIFGSSLSPRASTRESAQTGRFARSRASRSRFTNASSAVAWEMKILPDMAPPRAENPCGTVAAAPQLISLSSTAHPKGFKQKPCSCKIDLPAWDLGEGPEEVPRSRDGEGEFRTRT